MVPTLTVTSPNGGEEWELGSSQTIAWGSSGLARLSSGGSSIAKDKKKKKLNIKKGSVSQSLTKQSGKNSPLGRTKTSKDTKKVSLLASFSRSSNVKIELYSNGSLYGVISNSTDNNGSYSWTIPFTYDEGSNYKVRISDAADSDIYDESDGYFRFLACFGLTFWKT